METETVSFSEQWRHVLEMQPEIWEACLDTFKMMGIGLSAAVFFGLPLGIVLFLTRSRQLFAHPVLNRVLSWLVNLVRSFPFIILVVVLSPLTSILAGTSIGPLAAAVPLSFAAIPYFARLVEQALIEVPRGVIEAAEAMGATPLQIIIKVLLAEARATLVSSFTILSISFLGYSAAAGMVGGGGIGDLAIRYGYQRYDTPILIAMVILLIVIVQIIQLTGNHIAQRLDKR
jgi:D-methionine transport system permease protein